MFSLLKPLNSKNFLVKKIFISKAQNPRNKLLLLIGYANKKRSVCLVNFHLFGLNSASELLTEKYKKERKNILKKKFSGNRRITSSKMTFNNRHVSSGTIIYFKINQWGL